MGIVCLATAMLAAGSAGPPPERREHRLDVVLPEPTATSTSMPAGRRARSTRLPRRLALAAVALLAGMVAVGGMIGVLLGATGAMVAIVVRPGPVGARIDPGEVPLVADLIAGCLAAGAALPDALLAAGSAADDALRGCCVAVADALRSGAPAEEAWQPWLAIPTLAPVARTLVRTTVTGAAAAADLERTAARLRAQRRAGAQHRVRRASVWLVVPLGLGFLPAFVLVAVVPLVVGLVPALR